MSEVVKKETTELPRFRPDTDIIEMEDGFHIFLDIPGIDKNILNIDMHDNEVTISGRTHYGVGQSREEMDKYLHFEFGHCEYRRSFTLSDEIDREHISAQLKNGVLELYLPKSEKMLPKRISIREG
ncbi:HSP20 family protein [Desulfovibrionales bacterium]